MGDRAVVSEREQTVLRIIETARGKRAKFRDARINMAHGAGGKATQGLIEGLLAPAFHSAALDELGDAGAVAVDGAELALTTDSYVVKPLRFPGGSIGELAVNGTVNDLAVSGARPVALSVSLILEEGLAAEDLRAEVEAIARAADAAGVGIVTGDTKVVERGHADGMYICTSGVGRHDPRARLSPAALRPGDRILLSGSIGEHGTAIMLARNEFELDAEDLGRAGHLGAHRHRAFAHDHRHRGGARQLVEHGGHAAARGVAQAAQPGPGRLEQRVDNRPQ